MSSAISSKRRKVDRIVLWIRRDPSLLKAILDNLPPDICRFPQADCGDCPRRADCHGE